MTATPEQLHAALTYCMDFARMMLDKSGEFYPFGATINPAGDVETKAAYTGDERPDPRELYQLLLQGLRADMSQGAAIALAAAVNVNIPKEYSTPYPDGVRVFLETAGYARLIYTPYKLKRAGLFGAKRVTEFADAFAVELPPAN